MSSTLFLFFLYLAGAHAQQTFQQYRFDLDPNMPAEEPTVLAQVDALPRTHQKSLKKKLKEQKRIKIQNPNFAQQRSGQLQEQLHTAPLAIRAIPTAPFQTQQPQFSLRPQIHQLQPQQPQPQPQPPLQPPPQLQPQPQQFYQQNAQYLPQNHFYLPANAPRPNFQPSGFGAPQQQPLQFQPFTPPPPFQTTTPIQANPAKTPIPILPELIPRQPVRLINAPADVASPEDLQFRPPPILYSAVTFAPNTQPLKIQPISLQQQHILPRPAPELTIKTGNADEIVEVSSLTEASKSEYSSWFKENYDTNVCREELNSMALKFRLKFPSNLASRSKDSGLANLVQTRLIECDKKANAGHWEKVNSLLNRITKLSRTEMEDCRSGLIQEQISCQNLLNSACQFVEPAFQFRLVPARLIIEEARNAENGSDKCRSVVRAVRQRLEQ